MKNISTKILELFLSFGISFRNVSPEEERPTYGITTKIDNKINPLYLNFHEYESMYSDVKTAKTGNKKLFYIFGSPGKIDKIKKKTVVGVTTVFVFLQMLYK